MIQHRTRHYGFTLIELSIVLVIIGLLVGGILVGKDMIYNAKVRAQITQLEQFRAAVNAFKGKYNALPGDIVNPASFGLYDLSGTAFGEGDGNGLIENQTLISRAAAQCSGELMMFWRHLSEAGMIEGNYTHDAGTGTVFTPGRDAPLAKWGMGVLVANSDYDNTRGTKNNFLLGARSPPSGAWCHFAEGGPLKPFDLYSLDSKIDDGLPLTGKTQVRYTAWGVGVMLPVSAGFADGNLGSSCTTTAVASTAQYTMNSIADACQTIIAAGF